MEIGLIMTPCAHTIPSTASLQEALESMWEKRVRHLPVIEDGQVVGVLSESDLLLSKSICLTTGYCPNVGEIYRKEPKFVKASTSASEVTAAMTQDKLDAVLITDGGGRVIGIFTTTDVCRLAYNLLEEKRYR